MHRIPISSKDISGQEIIISDKHQIHRLKDILRIKVNEQVGVFDEQANEYLCQVQDLAKNRLILRIKHKLMPRLSKTKITLACAIPKKGKFDDIVDKLTQLAVDRIIPLKSERVIVKLDKRKECLRQERWQKIAYNALLQSQRNTAPQIDAPQQIEELLGQTQGFDLKLIATLSGRRKALREIIGERSRRNILILIGPEGDFTEAEVNLAVSVGCIAVSLGESVLRVDTAAIAVASFIRLYEEP